MTRSKTNRTTTFTLTSRRLATAMFGVLAPLALLACPKEEPPPQQPIVQPQPQPMPQSGLTPEIQAKVDRACAQIAQCKNVGRAGAEFQSCLRDLGRPESYQGACGAQQVSLLDCINNLQSCDQAACAPQSAAVTACGVIPAGLLNSFFKGQ